MASHSGGGNFFSRPLSQNYPEDCDMLFFCEKNAQTYRLCYNGTPVTSKRCSPAEKNLMLMFSEVVHRVQLIDETVKQFDSELTTLLRRAETADSPKPETAQRFEQSQAASLITPPNSTVETSAERASFSAGLQGVNSVSPEQERIVRRNGAGKQK